MQIISKRRFVNPRLGIYFGVFTSLYLGLVLITLILEQLGVQSGLLRQVMLVGPVMLYVAIGVAAQSREPADFFASGRRVPAAYCGLGLAISALGATGMVAITGLFFINGADAWCIAVGIWSGFVVMALVVAPYLRKFGAYTLPSYLGRRFESRIVRLTAAGMLVIPALFVAVAELKIGAYAASWLSGAPQGVMMALMVIALVVTVGLGGMRSLNWSGTAQSIAAIIALLVPVVIVATLETNLPLPQLSHGPVLRGIARNEHMQGIPILIAGPLAFDLAGQDLEALANRIAQPYANVGPVAFILMSLSLMCGVASAPWLIMRSSSTPSVYEARKSCAWAIVFSGLVLLSAASVAVFLRDMVMDQVVGRSAQSLPQWFERLKAMGVAAVEPSGGVVPLTGVSFARDAVLAALPIAARFTDAALFLALAGIVAAALMGAASAVMAIGNSAAEDGISGLVWDTGAPALRLNAARVAIAGAAVLTGVTALILPADPLDLLLWAFSLTASAAFPVIVLSVWWKRINALGAMAGMTAGFGVAMLALLAGEAALLGVPGPLAATFGVPAGFAAAIFATRTAPAPGRHVLQIVNDLRRPGGETIYDHEVRLERLKQRRG